MHCHMGTGMHGPASGARMGAARARSLLMSPGRIRSGYTPRGHWHSLAAWKLGSCFVPSHEFDIDS